MSRAIGPRVGRAVDSRKHQHRQYGHGYAIPGQTAGICAVTRPKLNRSRPASWNLAGLDDQGDSIPLRMSAGFRARNQPRLCQPTTRNSGGGRGHGNADGRSAYGSESFLGSTGTKIGDVYNALTSHKYDTLVLRTRPGVVNVRRGRDVSETEWASLDTDRKVKFSPRIGMTLIPARRELYPTPARKAACFFSEHDAHQESRRISTGRKDSAEWAALLAETREDAWRARQYNKQVQARTEAGEKARQQQRQGPHRRRPRSRPRSRSSRY